MGKDRLQWIETQLGLRNVKCPECRDAQSVPREDFECISVRRFLAQHLHLNPKEIGGLQQDPVQYGCGCVLHLDDMLYLNQQEQRWHDKIDEWGHTYGPVLLDFRRHMEQYPFLGLDHPIGKRIFDSIESLPQICITKENWWRARKPDAKDPSRTFVSDDMLPPDPERVRIPEGRFNHAGQRVLYLGASRDTAAAEALGTQVTQVPLPDSEIPAVEGTYMRVLHESGAHRCHKELAQRDGIVWVQEFLVQSVDRVLDISNWEPTDPEDLPVFVLGILDSYAFREPAATPSGECAGEASSWKPYYLIPRFLADVARRKGYNGIKYCAQRYSNANLVLFNPDSCGCVQEELPVIYEYPDSPFQRGRPVV